MRLHGNCVLDLSELGIHGSTNVTVDLLNRIGSVHIHHLVLRALEIHHRHTGFDKCVWQVNACLRTEALLDRVHVIIGTSTCLTTPQKTLQHDLFGTMQEQHKLCRANALLELFGLVKFARKSVN